MRLTFISLLRLRLVQCLRSSSGSDFFDPVSPSQVVYSVLISDVTDEENTELFYYFYLSVEAQVSSFSCCHGDWGHPVLVIRHTVAEMRSASLTVTVRRPHHFFWSIISSILLSLAFLADSTWGCVVAFWWHSLPVRAFINVSDWESRSKLFIEVVSRASSRISSINTSFRKQKRPYFAVFSDWKPSSKA